MKVLAVCSYPTEAAATRFRIEQYAVPLSERGITLSVSPFFESRQFRDFYKKGSGLTKSISTILPLIKRVTRSFTLSEFDVLLVQRESMFFGPPIFEWIYRNAGRMPMVLDLDDATYVRYESPNFGKIAGYLKFFGKTDRLIDRSAAVICGNRYIAEYVESRGGKAHVIPTICDPSGFGSKKIENEVPVIGWIGTNSTFPFLKRILPVLQRLAELHKFELKIIGAGSDAALDLPGVSMLDWQLEREKKDLESFDIGLYPIFDEGSVNEAWLKGKSGFKAIQYMSAGIPFVMSPVGICAEIGEDQATHFNASTEKDWFEYLSRLLESNELRTEMGSEGKLFASEHFSLNEQVSRMEDILKRVTTEHVRS